MASPQSERDIPCDICGGCGFADFITVCSQCNEAREHIYCMEVFLDKVPDTWSCKQCKFRDDPVSPRPKVKGCKPTPDSSDTLVGRSLPESSVNGGIPRNFPAGKAWPAKVSKVKFIPTEEAQLLSSEVMVKAPAFRSRFGCSSPQPKKAMLSSVLRRSTPLKDNFKKGISSANSVASQSTAPHVMHLENVASHPLSVKPPNPLHVEASSRVECKPKTSKRLTGVKSSSQVDPGPAISKPLINGKQEEDEACRLFPVVAPAHVPPRKLSSLLEAKLPNHPLPDALWNGNFEIFDSAYDHCPHFCYGIQAHRPIIVSSKACEVSRWMPNVLQLKLQPRCDIWPRIFLKDSPDANDIALYFFSDNCDRSRLNYIHLVELMEHHDWAMTGYIDGVVHVELLIFTSKQLPVGSQRLNMQIYLWGVFICKKDATATSCLRASSLPPHAPPIMRGLQDCVPGHEYVTQSQVNISDAGAKDFDMEIDMIGGKVVGRVDMPVPSLLDSKNSMASATHLNGHEASPDRSGLGEGSFMINQEFPIPSSMSIEHDGLLFPSSYPGFSKHEGSEAAEEKKPSAMFGIKKPSHVDFTISSATSMEQQAGLSFPPDPPGFSKPVRSEATEKKVEKLSAIFGMKKPRHVRFTDVPPCSTMCPNMKDGNCQSDSSNYKDGRSAVRSSEVQSSTNITIPRALPGFTKNTSSSIKHQPSQATCGKQKFPLWSTRPRSRRVTKRIGSGGFLGAPLHKNHALQSPRCAVESQIIPANTNPNNTKKVHQLPKASDYREVNPVGGSMKMQSPSECIIPAIPGFAKLSNLVDEYQLPRDAVREGKVAMVKIQVQGEVSKEVFGSPGPFDAKDDLRMSGALTTKDEKHTLYRSDIRSLSHSPTPGAPPGFRKLVNPNDGSPDSQPSRATIRSRKDITGSSETYNSGSNGDTETVEAASSGALLGSWFPTVPTVPPGFTKLTNPKDETRSSGTSIKSSTAVMGSFKMHSSASKSAIENLEDKQKPQFDPPTTTGCNLNLFPEVLVEMSGVPSPCEPSQKQLLPDKDLFGLSLSRPLYLRDGNRWIAESSKELLKQGGGTEELRLRL